MGFLFVSCYVDVARFEWIHFRPLGARTSYTLGVCALWLSSAHGHIPGIRMSRGFWVQSPASIVTEERDVDLECHLSLQFRMYHLVIVSTSSGSASEAVDKGLPSVESDDDEVPVFAAVVGTEWTSAELNGNCSWTTCILPTTCRSSSVSLSHCFIQVCAANTHSVTRR